MQSFYNLQPEKILDAVEDALNLKKTGNRATGRIQGLNSVENRVNLIELEDNTSVVAKFYRPNRWTSDQILEEHQFLVKLNEEEVPAVAPLEVTSGQHSKAVGPTLAESPDGIYFAIFPQIKGRLNNELSDEQMRIVGRFMARIHLVGDQIEFKHRLNLNVETYGKKNLEYLINSPHMDDNTKIRYEQVAHTILTKIEPLFQSVVARPIHGDCHMGNLLWKNDNPFFVDFDDCLSGPRVQDMWMILMGRDEATRKQQEELLKAYEQIRSFNEDELQLIEPLRALRLMHYAAWIARRWEDPAFPRLFPLFGTQRYWQEELEALHGILELI